MVVVVQVFLAHEVVAEHVFEFENENQIIRPVLLGVVEPFRNEFEDKQIDG